MPPWWEQLHRRVDSPRTPVAWVCTCGGMGRLGEPSLTLFALHLEREKKKFEAFTVARRGLRQHTPAYSRIWRHSDGKYRPYPPHVDFHAGG